MLLKLVTFSLILTTFACGQLGMKASLPPDELKAATQNIVNTLKQKPTWLFEDMVCPIEIMPTNAGGPKYMADGCKHEPGQCLKRCQANDASGCYALALLMQEYVELNDPVPQALFYRSCKLGITSGCTNRAASISEVNPKDAAQQKCATDTFEKTCDRNDPWGCSMFGFALYQGIGRPKNNSEALKVLKKACAISADKSGSACKNANDLVEMISKEKP